MMNQTSTQIEPYHPRELRCIQRWCNWMNQRIADGLAARFQHINADGSVFVPRIADAVVLRPWYHLVVMDPHALGSFSKRQLASDDTLAFLTGLVQRPVRAITVIPATEPGQPARHGLAYVVTLKDIPPPKAALLDAPLPRSVLFDPIGDYPTGQLYQWCLGFDGRRLVWRSIQDTGHILIAGTTQKGKTVTWKINALLLILNHSPELLRLVVIDPKGVDSAFLDESPHLLMPIAVGMDVTAATKAMARLQQEILDRQQLMRGVAGSLEEYNRKVPDRPLPLIVGIFDEFASLADLAGGPRAPLFRYLLRVINQGAALGIYMILTTQSPLAEIVGSVSRSQCNTRIVLHCTEAGQFKAALGLNGYNGLMGQLNVPGRALVRIAGQAAPILVQMPFLSNDQIAAIAARWRSPNTGEAGPILVANFPFLTADARRLVRWALSHPDEFRGGMSLTMLKRAFEVKDEVKAADGGEPLSEWRIRRELDALKARGLLVRGSGSATLPYQMTPELIEMVAV